MDCRFIVPERLFWWEVISLYPATSSYIRQMELLHQHLMRGTMTGERYIITVMMFEAVA